MQDTKAAMVYNGSLHASLGPHQSMHVKTSTRPAAESDPCTVQCITAQEVDTCGYRVDCLLITNLLGRIHNLLWSMRR